MILLECPNCGPRDETEYGYGGEAHVPYPEDPHTLSDEEWGRYLFYRRNPKGLFAERWVHTAGCRKWFNVVRDTATYRIAAIYRLDDPRPDLSQSNLAQSKLPPSKLPPSKLPQSKLPQSKLPGEDT